MPTHKQTEANRRNAQHSTGPRTAAGKARSAMNAYKTGIDAKTAILPGHEDAAAFEALKAEYHDFHQPRTPEARRFCDQLALHEWFDHRLARLQVALFEHEFQTAENLNEDCALGQAYSNASAKFARLQHHVTANNRGYLQCLDKLEEIEDQYPEDPQPPEAPKPELPTPQPAETKPETPQLASFHQNGSVSAASLLPQAPAPSPQPLPLCPQPAETKPETPQLASFHQNAPQPSTHPTLEDCPNCRNLGYINPNCHYVLRSSQP